MKKIRIGNYFEAKITFSSDEPIPGGAELTLILVRPGGSRVKLDIVERTDDSVRFAVPVSVQKTTGIYRVEIYMVTEESKQRVADKVPAFALVPLTTHENCEDEEVDIGSVRISILQYGVRNIVDNLVSDDTTSALSAKQGRVLKEIIEEHGEEQNAINQEMAEALGNAATKELLNAEKAELLGKINELEESVGNNTGLSLEEWVSYESAAEDMRGTAPNSMKLYRMSSDMSGSSEEHGIIPAETCTKLGMGDSDRGYVLNDILAVVHLADDADTGEPRLKGFVLPYQEAIRTFNQDFYGEDEGFIGASGIITPEDKLWLSTVPIIIDAMQYEIMPKIQNLPGFFKGFMYSTGNFDPNNESAPGVYYTVDRNTPGGSDAGEKYLMFITTPNKDHSNSNQFLQILISMKHTGKMFYRFGNYPNDDSGNRFFQEWNAIGGGSDALHEDTTIFGPLYDPENPYNHVTIDVDLTDYTRSAEEDIIKAMRNSQQVWYNESNANRHLVSVGNIVHTGSHYDVELVPTETIRGKDATRFRMFWNEPTAGYGGWNVEKVEPYVSASDKERLGNILGLFAGEGATFGEFNADQVTEPGLYMRMTSGTKPRPALRDEEFALLVTARKPDGNGGSHFMQICQSLLRSGQTYYRWKECGQDGTLNNIGDWERFGTAELSCIDIGFQEKIDSPWYTATIRYNGEDISPNVTSTDVFKELLKDSKTLQVTTEDGTTEVVLLTSTYIQEPMLTPISTLKGDTDYIYRVRAYPEPLICRETVGANETYTTPKAAYMITNQQETDTEENLTVAYLDGGTPTTKEQVTIAMMCTKKILTNLSNFTELLLVGVQQEDKVLTAILAHPLEPTHRHTVRWYFAESEDAVERTTITYSIVSESNES